MFGCSMDLYRRWAWEHRYDPEVEQRYRKENEGESSHALAVGIAKMGWPEFQRRMDEWD